MGRPKALLPFQGTTFIHHILETVKASALAPVVVVLGGHRQEIERALPFEVCAFNPDYEQGMITSLQTGIRSLPAGGDGAMLFLVDHPVTSPQTIVALLAAFKPHHIVLPTFNGRRGHPVLFSRSVMDEILELPPSSGANRVVWKDPSRVVEVPVDDAGILVDVDTPEQYGKLS